jgi:protein-S-isoprenylcysteine O-methyltransferase Ste14
VPPLKLWLCRQKRLRQHLNALDHGGWWRVSRSSGHASSPREEARSHRARRIQAVHNVACDPGPIAARCRDPVRGDRGRLGHRRTNPFVAGLAFGGLEEQSRRRLLRFGHCRIVAGFLAGLALASGNTLSLPAPVLWVAVGLIIAWAGMLLRLWAVLTLGRFFTTTVVVRAEQTVVTGGPYRFVRHPSYLGVLILLFGFGLALGDLASAVAMVVLPTMGLLWRIKVEEAALRAELGDRYIEYCKGHARLIPGIW